jgi:histidyl-tRNA synthetase
MTGHTRPARGMRDFLPEDIRRREYVASIVERVYRTYGFEPLETPALENIETLTGKYGEEGNKLIFKVLRRGEHEGSGETDLALRYDLTVPLARVVAEYRGVLPRFFKRYQIQPVWRADRPARGRFREFYQCDVDAIGSRSMVVEAEVCSAVTDVLLGLGFEEFDVKINHRRVLAGLLTASGVPELLHGTALVALDKLDKIGLEGVERELRDRGVPQGPDGQWLGPWRLLLPFWDGAVDRAEANRKSIAALRSILANDSAALEGVSELESILAYAATTTAGTHLRFDATLARGLSYYTGAIMEIAVADLAGSLGGGGRYDGLIGMFSGENVPACGFSLGFERILVVMTERKMFPPGLETAAADVMVTLFDVQGIADTLALAAELRRAGLRVDVYPEPDKLGKQFKYASSRGVRFVTVTGSDERAQGVVTVKDMQSGQQTSIARAEIADWVASHIGRGSPAAGRADV